MARGTASGCDAALRPRGRARVARTGRRRRIGRGHVAGGHAIMRSTWAPVWGATWQAGEWRAHGNSGPWLDFRGGNAISVYRPLIYRRAFLFFLPCGTMSHTILLLQDTWRRTRRSILSKWLRSRGPESTRSLITTRAKKESKWIKIDGLPCDTWTMLERWIFIERRASRSQSSPRSSPI